MPKSANLPELVCHHRLPPPSAMEKGSVAICFVHHAIAGLHARGIDPDPVLRGAGIAPALLAVPQARVSSASYSELSLAVAAALDDEFFGQDARSMKCGSFAM